MVVIQILPAPYSERSEMVEGNQVWQLRRMLPLPASLGQIENEENMREYSGGIINGIPIGIFGMGSTVADSTESCSEKLALVFLQQCLGPRIGRV
jgi:hypothetical protein